MNTRTSLATSLIIVGLTLATCKIRHQGTPLPVDRLTPDLHSQTVGLGLAGTDEGVSRVQVRLMKGARIVFDANEFDFGSVESGIEIEHVFQYRNEGDGPLIINEVLSSCGCTGAVVTSGEVPPGGVGELKATFRTKGLQGSVKKALIVESNDPERKLVRIAFKGNVLSDVMADPWYLNWGNVSRSDPPQPLRLAIHLRPGMGIRVEEVRSESELLVIEKLEENSAQCLYSVGIREKLPIGRFTGRITIRTNSQKVPEIHVPFYALIESNVRAVPPVLSFGTLSPGGVSTRELSLRRAGKGGNFTVTSVTASTDKIRTDLRKVAEGTRFKLIVKLETEHIQPGDLAERLIIHLRDDQDEILEVPVYGRITDRWQASKPSS